MVAGWARAQIRVIRINLRSPAADFVGAGLYPERPSTSVTNANMMRSTTPLDLPSQVAVADDGPENYSSFKVQSLSCGIGLYCQT